MNVIPIRITRNSNAICIRDVLRQPIFGQIWAFIKENIKIPAPAPAHETPLAMGR